MLEDCVDLSNNVYVSNRIEDLNLNMIRGINESETLTYIYHVNVK